VFKFSGAARFSGQKRSARDLTQNRAEPGITIANIGAIAFTGESPRSL